MIYEFDPADIMYSYMYPAMVRTFRTAGFQWITQFSYDPMDIAYANTEYQTHFLNLAYTPQQGNQHENSFRGSTKPEERRILRKLSTRYVVR